MQTDHATPIEHPVHPVDHEVLFDQESPISVTRFTHMLRSYSQAIILSLIAVALGYVIIALAVYLFSPSAKVTSQAFRLDFEGAGKGEYPNKAKFTVADIVKGPILMRVWQDNHLTDYVPFGAFSRSVYVLESNREYEQLLAEYEGKLADLKLSPLDRDRLEQDFALKRQSIAKNEYAIYLDRRGENGSIPEPVAKKVLIDILNTWADFAVNQQHVLTYEVSVLSPEMLAPSATEQNDPVSAIAVLRSKARRVADNLEKIERLPGAKLARTANDRLSLEEIGIRLDEIIRFRLEPLLTTVVQSPGLVSDRAAALRFLESQLAYDQRELEATERLADSARDAIAVYEQGLASKPPLPSPGTTAEREPVKSTEAISPQFSDTFLDRIMNLSQRADDPLYRQSLVNDYRKTIAATIPLRIAVGWDSQIVNEMRKSTPGSSSLGASTVRTEVDSTRAEIGQLIGKMNELFVTVSRNMTPSSQLFSLTSPASTHVARTLSLRGLTLYGAFVLLLAIPIILASCLLHNRIREEEAAAEFIQQQRKLSTADAAS